MSNNFYKKNLNADEFFEKIFYHLSESSITDGYHNETAIYYLFIFIGT